jgi:hypothetical protein
MAQVTSGMSQDHLQETAVRGAARGLSLDIEDGELVVSYRR